jgi:hypothetical protein
MVMFDSVYARIYAYQVPLFTGIAYGMSVSGRVVRLNRMLVGVPEQRRLWRMLAIPLSRPPAVVSVLVGIGMGVFCVIDPLGMCWAPWSVMDFGLQFVDASVARVQWARLGAVVFTGGVIAIYCGVLCHVAGAVASRVVFEHPLPPLGLLASLAFLAHRSWGNTGSLSGGLTYLVQYPSVLFSAVDPFGQRFVVRALEMLIMSLAFMLHLLVEPVMLWVRRRWTDQWR